MTLDFFTLETTWGSMAVAVIKPLARVKTNAGLLARVVLPSGGMADVHWGTDYLGSIDGEDYHVFLNCEDRESFEDLAAANAGDFRVLAQRD